ncbi:MAG: xanthine dehydrogenase family protein molybdopterin-binding subunit [Thermoanaerobaculia bacterium]|nr:xanthine dehydrogenase family protein molybdopterin-binding subunit [Thermoanaerobaculia bacterium]
MRASPELTRRGFLKTSAVVGGGLVVGFFVPTGMRRLLAQGAPAAAKLPAPNAFLRIAPDDSVTVLLAHSEMGQGIWTTLPMLLNEELGADWSRIRVEHAPASMTYAHTAFGIQATGGSTTTWSEFDRYRQVGAAARQLLVTAAARRWNVPESECRTEKGFVVHGEKRLSYGSLADDASKLPVPSSVTLKDAKDWTVIGKPTRRLDTPEKVTGKAIFGLDVKLPGMLTAVVAHAPTFGGKVKSFDAKAAKGVAGVKAVYEIPTGVAVAADSFWAAKLGRDALKIEWEKGPNADLDTKRLLETYCAKVTTPGTEAKAGGDVQSALSGPGKKITAEYSVPYLAHATMEPLNCTIRKTPDGCEVWAGTQFQTVDQQHIAGILGLKPEQVAIHTTFLGGGFGRRANPVSDLVSEAAHVAKGVDVPVKLMWTREDDMRGGYYRPLAVHRVEGALDEKGAPVAWRHRIATQSICAGTPFEGMMIKNGVDATSVEGASNSPYLAAIANHRVELHTMEKGVPVLWWRSVGHTHTAFAVESFVDELAHAAGRDPLEFRRALLAKSPRHLAVLERAAAKAGWGTPLPTGRARGLAVHESFGSWVAQVAEVSVEGGRIRVHRVVCAIDCGIAVNPLSIAAQMESAIAFGLGAALHGAITLQEGRVVEGNFNDYRVLRLNEMPRVDVEIVQSREKPGGAGEPGTPPIAPAVANAVFALTGKRLRALPFRLS